MKTKVVLTLFLASAFLACKKDSVDETPPDDSGPIYYFNYTIGAGTGGHSFNKSLMDLLPSSQWSSYAGTGGMEVISGTLPNPTTGSGTMSAGASNSISVVINSNCSNAGRPTCFIVTSRLDKLAAQEYTAQNGLLSFSISELTTSPNALSVAFDGSPYGDPDENMTITISSVEPIGGLVKGEFSGKLKNDYTNQLVDVFGKFSVVHTY
jgi:hypothetical protein